MKSLTDVPKFYTKEQLWIAVAVPALSLTVAMTFFASLFSQVGNDLASLKEKLIEKGYAEYVVIDNKTGKTEFKLK